MSRVPSRMRDANELKRLMFSIDEDLISCSKTNESDNDFMDNLYDYGLPMSCNSFFSKSLIFFINVLVF